MTTTATEHPTDPHAAHRAHIVSEVEWLTGTDRPENIARRLGYRHVHSLARLLDRAGRHDLAHQFWALPPAAHKVGGQS